MDDHQEIPNQILLDEIRLNRADIKKVDDKLDGKVGRGEMFGWLGTLGLLASLLAAAAVVSGAL